MEPALFLARKSAFVADRRRRSIATNRRRRHQERSKEAAVKRRAMAPSTCSVVSMPKSG
jgi:hypothetical protein